MSYEIKVHVGMLFKKMFCCKCGIKLQKKKMSKINFKGDIGFKRIKYGHTISLDKKQIIDSVVYFCPNCNIITKYPVQLIISKIQKKKNKLILDDNDLK